MVKHQINSLIEVHEDQEIHLVPDESLHAKLVQKPENQP